MSTETKTQSYAELRDIPRVSISEAKMQLAMSLKYRQKRGCIVLVGDAGAGKSQAVKQVGKESGKKVITLNSSHFSMMGSGIPAKPENGKFRVALPNIFPTEHEEGILFFDEWNRGPKHTLDMFFTLLEDGTQFDYKLPDGFIVAGAMNPSTATYTVTQIENDPAMRRRLKFLYVVPSFKEWLDHAKSTEFHAFSESAAAAGKPCHPKILSYFRGKPNNWYDQKGMLAGKQYCTPAGIETISVDTYTCEQEGIALTDDFLTHRIAASIGNGIAEEIAAHIANTSVNISATDVLYHYDKVRNKIQKVCAEGADREILSDIASNVIKLIFSEVPSPETFRDAFVEFFTTLPKDLAAGTLQQLKPEAVNTNQEKYLLDLMRSLQHHDAWINLFSILAQAEKAVSDALNS